MKYLYRIYLSYISILFCIFPTEVRFEFLIIQVWISDVLTHSKKLIHSMDSLPEIESSSTLFLLLFFFFKILLFLKLLLIN